MTDKRKAKVLALFDQVLAELHQEMEAYKSSGRSTYAVPSLHDLENIERELEQMKSALSPKICKFTYERQITDSWSFDFRLGELLLKLNQEYVKLP